MLLAINSISILRKITINKKIWRGAGEMAQQLRIAAALTGNPHGHSSALPGQELLSAASCNAYRDVQTYMHAKLSYNIQQNK